MKPETIADIAKLIRPFLQARAVFIVILVLTIAFWAAFFFPQLFTYLGLDAWQTSNTTFIGLGFIITSLILIIALFIIITNWISSKARTKRNTREFQDLLDNLTPSELIYLAQFIEYKTLQVEFNETDPVVGLLCGKELIYPSINVRIGPVVRFHNSYPNGQIYEMTPELHSYLTTHPEVFSKLRKP
ncbi:MAG: hypothetical protein A2029_11200 [Chloroflexi bacterium RBG_19FT_COMBO_47_9]|nr:MAG: hypothetical protein A2029_11200 [Chloroflexi bacterium RBG_19FT_COMBO_47_9]